MSELFKKKFLGSILGHLLGDSIGELAFSYGNREQLDESIKNSKMLRYTDDSAMAIGTIKFLIENDNFDEEKLGEKFYEEYLNERWRGYASGPPKIFKLVREKNMKFTEAAASLFNNSGSFGNGAAMRITPIALYFHETPKLEDMVKRSSSVTHTHIFGIEGALLIAKSIDLALGYEINEPINITHFISELKNVITTTEFMDKLNQIELLLKNRAENGVASAMLGESVSALESVPFAIFSFLKNSDSFLDTLYCSILNNGDCDTLGAMACGISGAYLGEDGLPENFLEKLENRDEVTKLGEKLFNKKWN